MKKLNLKKIIAMGLITTSILGVTSIGASAVYKLSENWKQDSTGWWYTEGNSYATGWRKINNIWYYFDNTGYMKTGWLQDSGKWYYLDSNGEMATTTTIIGGNMVIFGSDGVWKGYAKSSLTNAPDTSYTFDMAKDIVNKNPGFPMGGSLEYEVTQGGYNGRPKEDKVYTFEIGGKYYSYRIVGAIDKHTGNYVGSAYVFESGFILGVSDNVLLGTQTKFDETTFDISNVLQTTNTQTTTATKTQEQLDQEEMDRMSNPEYRKGHIDEYNKLMAKYSNK